MRMLEMVEEVEAQAPMDTSRLSLQARMKVQVRAWKTTRSFVENKCELTFHMKYSARGQNTCGT